MKNILLLSILILIAILIQALVFLLILILGKKIHSKNTLYNHSYDKKLQNKALKNYIDKDTEYQKLLERYTDLHCLDNDLESLHLFNRKVLLDLDKELEEVTSELEFRKWQLENKFRNLNSYEQKKYLNQCKKQ